MIHRELTIKNKYYDSALKLFKKKKIVFIGSQDSDGYPNIKAVLVADKKEGMKEIVIKTNTSSRHVQQFKENPKGCLYFMGLIGFKGAMLRGEYSVIEDDELKDKYWKKGDEKYYLDGYHDYCLLIFRAENGRYYHKYESGDFEIE